ncbi:hypothetical protein A6R70_16055 [Agrobacterium rubi]|uniref:DUF3426 domain-containing protein n=1 Tax=Agrobacterium rubi TaxID=28099 RepID=UPI00201B5EBA|nr:DUF3426 domain-containing protein [Agrobacterium rubi]MCL6653803.1 hypothetical protein [Agrobacterium rubi]
MFRSSRRHAAFDLDLLMPETPPRHKAQARSSEDIVDAEFVTIKETPARDYGNDNRRAASQRNVSKPFTGLDAFRIAIERIDRKLSGLSVDGYSAIVAAAVVGVFFLSGGFAILHKNEAVAAVVEPLGISHITITPQDAGGMEILVINGIVENNSGVMQDIPAIRADLFVAKGEKVASMLIEPPVSEIKAGTRQGFTAKLRHPGGKIPEIKLSFAQTGVSDR